MEWIGLEGKGWDGNGLAFPPSLRCGGRNFQRMGWYWTGTDGTGVDGSGWDWKGFSARR